MAVLMCDGFFLGHFGYGVIAIIAAAARGGKLLQNAKDVHHSLQSMAQTVHQLLRSRYR
jgi:hypothetical protein